jgi:hypothetical protein
MVTAAVGYRELEFIDTQIESRLGIATSCFDFNELFRTGDREGVC